MEGRKHLALGSFISSIQIWGLLSLQYREIVCTVNFPYPNYPIMSIEEAFNSFCWLKDNISLVTVPNQIPPS